MHSQTIVMESNLVENLVTLANPESGLPFHPDELRVPGNKIKEVRQAVQTANHRLEHLRQSPILMTWPHLALDVAVSDTAKKGRDIRRGLFYFNNLQSMDIRYP